MNNYTNEDAAQEATSIDIAPTVAEVTIEGAGISITRPINESKLSGIISLLFETTSVMQTGQHARRTFAEQPGQEITGENQRSSQWDGDLTLGEFIVETTANTFQQKICAAGYYLMKFQGFDSFNRDDVRKALADAHEDMPTNFARDFTGAASAHLIAGKQGEAGQFIIPRTGRSAVESLFQDLPKRRASRKVTKKATTTK